MAPWVKFESYSIIVHISELGRYGIPVEIPQLNCLAIYTRLEACCSITGVGLKHLKALRLLIEPI